jgi:hypothetical protein
MHSASCHRRTLLRTGLAAAVGAALGACGTAPPPTSTPPAATSRLRLIGESRLPSKMQFKGTTVGGLSGLDFDPARNLWVALSDDRSELQPARFYTLRIDLRPQSLAVAVTEVVTLRDAGGRPYPPRRNGGEVVDPEGIRLLPGGGGILWSSEGESRVNQHPAVHESRLDGRHVRSFEMPALLQFPQRPGTGPRDNQGFEGLALTPDARTAWVAMEGALLQDGPLPTVGAAGGPCRFTAFDVGTGRALRQVAYVPEAIPVAPKIPGTYADNGVSEILMLDAHRMLVLERAYALGTGNALRLFEVDTRDASDTLQQAKLAPGQFRPAAKKMVADFATLGLPLLDNTEGMCWGPARPGGGRTLVVVSDDNFNASQVTQFAAFDYLE